MIKTIKLSFVLLFLSTIYSHAVPFKWLKNEILEVCRVNQDVKLDNTWVEDNGKWAWNSINLSKGELLSVHLRKGKKTNWRWYATYSDSFPVKSTKSHKVTVNKNYGDKKVNEVITDCKKAKSKVKKIKFNTNDIFIQDDMFDGLEDNKKIKGFGNLIFPVQKKCKDIKKYPVMFLIHHSGGKIMTDYKHILHDMCIATFEPFIFKARGYDSNFYDRSKEISWTSPHVGALDSLRALDVLSKNKSIEPTKIGIMGWSWGGTVAIETQNYFNLDVIKPKNNFKLHLALYPFCYHYENTKTTDAPLFILMGDKDYLPHNLCEEYIMTQKDLKKTNKQIIVFKNTTHFYDKTGSNFEDGIKISSECRVYTDNNGQIWVRPKDKSKWFNISANGGWFGNKGDKKLYDHSMKICWGYGSSLNKKNQNAYEKTLKIFKANVNKYLINS